MQVEGTGCRWIASTTVRRAPFSLARSYWVRAPSYFQVCQVRKRENEVVREKPNQNQNQALFSFLYYFLDTKVSVNEITVFIEINLRFGKQT